MIHNNPDKNLFELLLRGPTLFSNLCE